MTYPSIRFVPTMFQQLPARLYMVQGRQQLPTAWWEGSIAARRRLQVTTPITPKIGWAIAHQAHLPLTPLWSKNIQKHTWLPRGRHWPHRKMKRLRIVGPLKHHPLPRPNRLGNGLQQKTATTQILRQHKKSMKEITQGDIASKCPISVFLCLYC